MRSFQVNERMIRYEHVIEHGKKSRAIFKAHYKNKIYMYECFIIVIQKVFHPLEHPHSMQYDPIYFTFEFRGGSSILSACVFCGIYFIIKFVYDT